MRHSYFGRKLSRTHNERHRLLRDLAREVIVHSAIKTSFAKAKAVQPLVEKLVTKAKNGSNASLQVIMKTLDHKPSMSLLLEDAKTRFSKRTSGYTRIVKLGRRLGDNSEQVLLSFVDDRLVTDVIAPKSEKKNVKVKEVVTKGKTEVKKAPVKRTSTKK